MSRSIEHDIAAARVRVMNDSRVVMTTDGKMVVLEPSERSATLNAAFPDFNKDNVYIYGQSVADNPTTSGEWKRLEYCFTWITAREEETSSTQVVMNGPANTDFFVGHVRLNRTRTPSHDWRQRALDPLPVENEWIPIFGAGSFLMEAGLGVGRAMHLYVVGNELRMMIQQSVAPPPEYGEATAGTTALGFGRIRVVHGGNGMSGSRRGIPFYKRQAMKAYGYATNPNGSAQPWTGSDQPGTEYHWSGPSPCVRNDVTDMRSTYRVEVRGRFGARSKVI
jgi:hypothetical protein